MIHTEEKEISFDYISFSLFFELTKYSIPFLKCNVMLRLENHVE